MKKFILFLLSLALLSGLPSAAFAQHFNHFHSRASVGVYIGPGGWYYPPPYYYYPPYPPYEPSTIVVQPAAPTVYVERNPAPTSPATETAQAPAPQASNDWYFCPSSKTYYPYVKECPEPWQRVSPTPPAPNNAR